MNGVKQPELEKQMGILGCYGCEPRQRQVENQVVGRISMSNIESSLEATPTNGSHS
jgi:hypothetical protein